MVREKRNMQNNDYKSFTANDGKRWFPLFRGGSGWGRYIYYLLIAAVLLVIAFVLFLKDKPGTLKVDNGAFAITDTSVVTSVRFSDGKNTILLDRSGSNWMVNRQFNARPLAIRALLNLLKSFEISAPVSNSMKHSVLGSFKKNAVSVVIESSGEVLKAYQITEDDSSKVGSFMMLKGDNEPYLMRVPEFNGRISKLFPCDPQFWRDKVIFRYTPADILSVEVDYPASPKSSFLYRFLGFSDLEIKSLNSNQSIKISKEAALTYLLNFASVPYEAQVKWRSKEIFDSLRHEKPYCQIQVKNAMNQLNIVKTYRIPVQPTKGEFDLNRMYAVHQNDTVPLLIKYIDFDPIMKEFGDFSGH
jgi:hypothetical protein